MLRSGTVVVSWCTGESKAGGRYTSYLALLSCALPPPAGTCWSPLSLLTMLALEFIPMVLSINKLQNYVRRITQGSSPGVSSGNVALHLDNTLSAKLQACSHTSEEGVRLSPRELLVIDCNTVDTHISLSVTCAHSWPQTTPCSGYRPRSPQQLQHACSQQRMRKYRCCPRQIPQ